MGLQPPKSPKLVIFGINVPKRGIPLKRFLQYLAFGRESRVRTLTPNFAVLTFKMWAYSLKNRNFWCKFTPMGKFWGFTGKVEYKCTTAHLPLCNGALTVLKIILLHSVSVITNFVIPKRDKKQTDRQKTSHFLSTAGARPRIPTILGMVIEEVLPIFAPPNFFGSDQ